MMTAQETTKMIDPRKFDDIARRIQSSLPPGLDEVREDVTRNIRAVIAAGIARMDLVEREEFDVQSAVLARTREKLEALERRVLQLEAQLGEQGHVDGTGTLSHPQEALTPIRPPTARRSWSGTPGAPPTPHLQRALHLHDAGHMPLSRRPSPRASSLPSPSRESSMSLATVMSRASVGIEAPPIQVEVHITGGLPKFAIVGLPEATVRESKDRVRSAIINSRFEFPRRRITVSLAPAELPKDGSRYDLPIAAGILAATGQLSHERLHEHELIGELALDGGLRRTGGSLPAALRVRDAGTHSRDPGRRCAGSGSSRRAPACSRPVIMGEVHAQLMGEATPHPTVAAPRTGAPEVEDLRDVRRQYTARRALEIAAAGSHNLLMLGPPGTGKTMLATPASRDPACDDRR